MVWDFTHANTSYFLFVVFIEFDFHLKLFVKEGHFYLQLIK